MNNQNVEIKGLIRDYPDFKYSTKELIDSLGNKLSEEVKENIFQLGVENRYFIRPFEQFLSNSSEKIQHNHGVGISVYKPDESRGSGPQLQ